MNGKGSARRSEPGGAGAAGPHLVSKLPPEDKSASGPVKLPAEAMRAALTRDSLLDILARYIHLEVKERQIRTDKERKFTGQALLLNFSLPNFYFHYTTAYDILRHCGVEVGKRDFMGTPVTLA
jgi:hypothetical protein